MTKTTKIIIGVILTLLVILVIINTSNKANSDTIKVGIIAPLTGPAASYGVEGKNTVVLALDQINESGGIKGKKIEYVIEDGKCDAKAALDAWNKLITINKVQAVFGGHCATESVAIAPLTIKSKVPAFAVFATAPTMENEGEWFFRHISTNSFYATVAAQEAFKAGYRKLAVIAEQKDFPSSYADALITEFKRLGGEVVLDERFSSDVKDFRTIALKLKGLNNDAVFISSQAAQTMGMVAIQIKELGLEKPTIFNHAFSYGKFVEVTKGYVPKQNLFVQPYSDTNTEGIKAFNDSYVKKYGQMYTFNSTFLALDYDLVNRFKNAADACYSNKKLDMDCVRDQFKNAKSYSGLAGNVEISSKYSPHGVITKVAKVQIVDGKEVITEIK